MTFAEFEQLPDPPGGRYELHHGELVFVAPPKHRHYLVQRRLRQLLEPLAASFGVVDIEIGFRPLPEHEYWTADVIFMTTERWNGVDPDGNIQGTPDLVIEVLSPSNTASEMAEKKDLCLETGAREFWIVNERRHKIEVSTPDGKTVTYVTGQDIPIFFAPGKTIQVGSVFA
jgi:Uma2 family endonuclease